jgi:1-deoxyxylulose-5-phosphate synthase
MKYERLGGSGLKIPRICLGTNNFGTDVPRDEARKILDIVLDLGANMLDTANIYTQGKSEEIIGEWARERRDEVIIATKVGMEQGTNPNRLGLSRANLIAQLEHSLKRLQTDYIDLYYLHQFDGETPLEETLKTLDSFVAENKVRYVACSNFDVSQLVKSLDVCKSQSFEKLVAIQSRYNLLQREIESDLIPFCKEHAVGVLAYSPLRSGLLTGRYGFGKAPPPGSRAARRGNDYWQRLNNKEDFEKIERFKEISRDLGIPLPVLSIAWILNQPGITSAVVGASSPNQFKESCSAIETEIPASTMKQFA